MPSSAILKCKICPRRPNFSDVSHLLTHVSSKGHLSHYFKLQVRSHQEPEAGELLAEYDQWYIEHNLAGLLSDRMMAKEARKGKGRCSNAMLRNINPSSRRASTSMLPPPTHTAAKNDHHSVPNNRVDPELTQPYVNMANSHAPNPCVQLWPTAAKRRSLPARMSAQTGWNIESPHSNEREDTSPLAQRRKPPADWTVHVDTPVSRRDHSPVTPDPFLDDASYEEDDDDDENREEASKLKGIFWPGMDIFDSATEQMRRKRNQKKDGSVLKQMEKTSEAVEPTEQVFSPGGTLRKERLISGMVDDSSPLKGETPIPKKRVSRPKRPALSQPNPNRILRSHSKLRGKVRGQHPASELERLSREGLSFVGSPRHTRRSARFGGDYGARDDDFRFSLSSMEQRSARGFPVFKDGSESTNSVNSSRTHRSLYNPLSNAAPYSLNQSLSSNLSIGSKSGKPGYMPEYRGKENIEPALTQRLDGQYMEPNWDTPNLTTEGRYGSQYLYTTGFQTYNSFENESFGYSANPLSCSLSQIQRDEEPKRGMGPGLAGLLQSPEHVSKSGRQASPDGTVSDLGQDDIGRMYFDEFTTAA